MPPLPNTDKFPNIFLATLAQSLAQGGSETEIFLSSIRTLDGQEIEDGDYDFLGEGVLTVDVQSASRIEFISFTGADSGNKSLTGAVRGLSFKDKTVISANKKFHSVGAPVVISWGTHNIIDVEDKITEVYDNLIAYIDSVVVTGGVPATELVPGIGFEATQTEVDNGTENKVYVPTGLTYPNFVTPDKLVPWANSQGISLGGVVLEALESLDAGDFVKIQSSDGDAKVAKVFGIGDSTAGFTAEAQAGTPVGTANNVNIIPLTSTLVVAFGVVSNNTSALYRYFVAGTVSDKTITWGTVAYQSIGTNTTTEYRLIKVNSTAFVIMANTFSGSSFIPQCYVATVSGTTITIGSQQNLGYSLSGTDDYRIYDGVLVDTNKICFVLNDSPSTDTNGVVCDVDTTARTLSPGAEFQVSSSVSSNTARVHLLSTNRVLFTYLSSYRVCTISGSTLTSVGTGSLPAGTITRFRFMKGATNSEGLAAWYDSSDCKIAKCVEAAGALTFSLEEDLSTGNANGLSSTLDNLQLYNSDMNKWLVITNQAAETRIAMLGTNSIILGSEITTMTISTNDTMTGVIDTEKFVQINTIGNSTSPYIVASLDYNDVFGVSQDTVLVTENTSVRVIGGKDENQIGLEPGFIYYLNAGANLTTASSDIVNGITFTSKKVGYSLSATSISLSNS